MAELTPGTFDECSTGEKCGLGRPASPQTATSTPQPAATTSLSNVDRSDPGIPLDEFKPGKGARPPAALLFPYGKKRKKEVGKWRGIQTSVVEWLIDTGRLTAADCPIKSRGGRQILVSVRPIKSNGEDFISPKQIGDIWIDVNKSASDHVRAVKSILDARNVDPADVRVMMKT